MAMNPLTPNIMNLFNADAVSATPRDAQSFTGGFDSIFSESLAAAGIAETTDRASTLQLMMGEADDLSGLMIDIQKAELSLQLSLQIRNKILDAYNEVMRMNV